MTYNFRLTNQTLGKKAEIFETQEYIDYQTYIGQLDQTTLDAVWDGQEHNWFDAVFAPSWSQQHSPARSTTGSTPCSLPAGLSSTR